MDLIKKIRNKIDHIRTGNKYKGCEICNAVIWKNPQPPIFTYDKKDGGSTIGSRIPYNSKYSFIGESEQVAYNHCIQIFFCKDCWDNLSVDERINIYLSRIIPGQQPLVIIKNICEQSGVNSDNYICRYIRKLKLKEINESIKKG